MRDERAIGRVGGGQREGEAAPLLPVVEHHHPLGPAPPSTWAGPLELAHRQGIEELVGDEQQRRLGDLSDVVEPVGGEVVAERRALALAPRRADLHRSEERRGGKGGVSTGYSRR